MLNSEMFVDIGLNHYLIVAALLFAMGMAGVLLRRNVIVIMMSIEIMLNAVNLTLIAFSKFTNNVDGQIMVFFIMTIAAAEAAVGFSITVTIFTKFKEVNFRFFDHLKV